MDLHDPFKDSEEQMQMIEDMLDAIASFPDLADEYFNAALDLRAGSQKVLVKDCDMPLPEYDGTSRMATLFSLWFGSAYLLHFLGENSICSHELKRFDCALCSRGVLIRKE